VNYNFKLVYNDSASTNATTVYFSGQVGNDPYPGGGAEDISRIEFTIVNNTGFVVELRA
jgi:enamine deaminase RidA (YjgF/YER057c/UK114 family)